MKKQFPLDSARWTVQAVGDTAPVPGHLRAQVGAEIPATVPGCVHTDLMAAGLLEDPYVADNELRQFWIGRTDWRYTCRFELTQELLSQEHLELVCEGLDTIAVLELNGKPIGEAANMHVAYRYDLRPLAVAGANTLVITFAAPMIYAEKQEQVYPGLVRAGGTPEIQHPHNLIRKNSCNMGWDWGPDVTTSGIWRPIFVEAWSTARIAGVRPLVMEASPERAVVRVFVDEDAKSKGRFTTVAKLSSPKGESYQPTQEGAALVFSVPHPELWWPVGHGGQPLYKLEVTLLDEKRQPLDRWERRIGLRTTSLKVKPDAAPVGDPIPDKQGECMIIEVNGKPIYCKGANWIPDDCFIPRVTAARYRQRITQALGANMNMLRIWGGGIYEEDRFYDICDELGVMVWQDFLFACACYPEEQPYYSLVETEARQNVARLSRHPSLVIWNGCNENIWASFDWGPKWVAMREKGERGELTWGLGYYLDLLPRVVGEVDPSRPYWPASPWSGSMDRNPHLNEYGNLHIWSVWHGAGQYRNYLSYYPRLATEFGYHGPASYATIAAVIPPEQMSWDSPLMKLHNKNGNPGQEQTAMRMADDFVPPSHDYDSWHFLAQIMQARALSMGVEWFRALYPWNSGVLYWQLNDCYPVSSWSAVDSDAREKPLLHASRRFFAPRLVTIKPKHVTPEGVEIGDLTVYLHNDSDEPWSGVCVTRLMSLDCDVIQEHRSTVKAGPRALVKFDLPPEMQKRRDAFLIAEVGSLRNFWWFAPDKELDYAAPALDASLSKHDGKYHLKIKAGSLLRDLCVFPDRIDPKATINDGAVTLIKGDEFTFVITSQKELTLKALTTVPVINCANHFGLKSLPGVASN